jgi:2-keto-3-deoxy-6-phosphogluconate aldolase
MTTKLAAALLATTVLAVPLAGCATPEETTKHDEALVSKGCPSIEVAAEEKCGSAAAIQEAKREQHDKQIEGEEHEAEAVIKHRHAEELANSAEGR